MKDLMENLLDAIASELSIRMIAEEQCMLNAGVLSVETEMYDYKKVPEDVIEIFKKEFNNHLYEKLQEIEAGEAVEYTFDYGNVRPMGTLMEDANDNMAEVLNKLPALNEGERYVFSCDTYIGFILSEKDKKHLRAKPAAVSCRISKKYRELCMR